MPIFGSSPPGGSAWYTQVTTALNNIQSQLTTLTGKVNSLAMGQADITAQAAAINTAVANLTSAQQAIQAEIAQLQANGVDTSGLDAAVSSLNSEVSNIQGMASSSSTSTTPPAST